MPRPPKYADEAERKQARALQARLRREANQSTGPIDQGGRPAEYSSTEAAHAARLERQRLRRRSAGVPVYQVTDTQAQADNHVENEEEIQQLSTNQQPPTEALNTQALLVGQLEELSIAVDRQEGTSQDAEELQQLIRESGQETALALPLQDGNDHAEDRVEVRQQPSSGRINASVASVAVTSNVTEPELQHHVGACVETEAEVAPEHDSTAHLEPIVLALPQTELEPQTIAVEEAVQRIQGHLPKEAVQVPVQTEEPINEQPQNQDGNVFTEVDDDAYVDFGNEDVTEEHEGQEDTSSLRLREEAVQEARQVAADYICTLASHRCYNHDHSVADGQAWTRPKSLWDAAQHTDSLLKILPRESSTDESTISHRPLKNQKLPHISQYTHVDWKGLYGADDPLNRGRGQLNFELSQDEALRRLGGRISLKRRWDVDSIMFRTTTLGVFNEGAELCFYPPFDRSIRQDPNVSFNGCKIHDCKNLLLAYGGASMIRWDCHLVLPKIQKTSRFDTRQLTHEQMAFWVDEILLPAVRTACDGDKTNHIPRSFEEIHNKAWTRGETTVVNHYQRAGSTDGSVETVGLGLSRAGKNASIGCYLQQEDLEEVWKEVLAIIQRRLASESNSKFADFEGCFLVVSSHGTKMATKGRDYTLSSARTKFKMMFERAFDTRPETIPTEDFYIDNGHEITPEKGSGLVLLRKTECLQHLGTSYICQTSGMKKVSQDNWKWAMTKDAGTTKIVTSKTNSLRTGGLANVKAYNLSKDIFVGLERSLPPFGEVKLEGLAFDADVLNRWLEHNKKGSSQHGGAGPRTRETLLDILRQVKRRVNSALEGLKKEAFGARAEDRMNIELYDLLQDPDSSWLEDITAEGIEDTHLPFWILPVDHVEAFWRSEIDRWLFGFERQIATVNYKGHEISVHQQFINSATASIFLRTLHNVASKGNASRPLQLWRSEYEIKDSQSHTQKKGKKIKKIKRYGLAFEESLKVWGMPFVSMDLLSWEVLAIQPTKLAKTAFFNSFGFELGFKRKLRELGSEALKASQALDQEEQWQVCLRQYLESLRPPSENKKAVARVKHGIERLEEVTTDLQTAETRRECNAELTRLRGEVKRIETKLALARTQLADQFREQLRIPTELAIQGYIQDVFKTLAGVNSKRLPVPGVRKLPKDVIDGRRGLTWYTFVQAFSPPGNLSVEPSLAQPKDFAPNQKSSSGIDSTFAQSYSHDWKGKMDGLFRVHDNITRHSWETKPYRERIRRIFAMIEETLHIETAKAWEAELGEAACRYIWAVPSFDSSNFSVLEKSSKNHTTEHQAAIKTRSVARRTKIIVPQIHTDRLPKLAKDEIDGITLLHDITRVIPREMGRLPNAGLDDETIIDLVGHVRLGLEMNEKRAMVKSLKDLLARPHEHMELMKPGAELPRVTLWGNQDKYADLGEDQKNRLPMTAGFTANVPILPIFNDLMQLKSADRFYDDLQDMVDKREQEQEEEADMEEESSSESELEADIGI